MSQSDKHYIVAIAAALTSIPEIRRFFDRTPPADASYIVIQPLAPHSKTGLGELISRHSKLVVKVAENETLIENNGVYIIPTNKYSIIQSGRLYLKEIKEFNKPQLTINAFLNSLAMDSGKKAIAVILSRLGSDGSEGVKAIKKAGGLVIVQDPACLGFAGMPVSAIANGIVDQILEPEQMPESIAGYMKNQGKFWSQAPAKERTLINQHNGLANAINTTLMTRLGFFSICIDENCQILKTYGDTSAYLFQNKITSDLGELLVKPLDESFKEGLWKVLDSGEQLTINAIQVPSPGSFSSINLSIVPMLTRKGESRLFLILFMLGKSSEIPGKKEAYPRAQNIDDFFQQIPEESGHTKAELKLAFGKLKTLNRNTESYNKELVAVNEELRRINEELRAKISRSSL